MKTDPSLLSLLALLIAAPPVSADRSASALVARYAVLAAKLDGAGRLAARGEPIQAPDGLGIAPPTVTVHTIQSRHE